MQEKELDELIKVADMIITSARNSIMLKYRFFYRALAYLKHQATTEISTFSTDGEFIYYNPEYVIESYKKDKNELEKIYIHSIIHCIFRHFYVSVMVNRPLWNLACDIAAESVVAELDVKKRERMDRQMSFGFYVKNDNPTHPNFSIQQELLRLSQKVRYMTAEYIYNHLLEEEITDEEFERLTKIFYKDDHISWYQKIKVPVNNAFAGDGQSDGGKDSFSSMKRMEGLAKLWQEVSEKMKVEMENFSKNIGSAGGGLTDKLEIANRKKVDYASFLKKFAILGESMKVNEDEFDYIFYNYGLELYERMPLIEPLEYKEIKKVKEFVIAIDTSGSVHGDMVKKFLEKTYDILMNQESFFSKINLHIIQCDAKIQKDVKITSHEELKNYMKNIELHGFGGTDFRPVFTYVDELIKKKEFTNLKGMIYFTDGYGVFPERQPEYKTAFLIAGDFNRNNGFVKVPGWAILLDVEKDDFGG